MRRALVAVVALSGLCLVHNAWADDAGIWQFLLGGGRGGGAPSPAPTYSPAESMYAAPSRSKKHIAHIRISRPKTIAHADLPQKGPVTIYNDRTLRRGDSVMTAQGLRVFRGAGHFPYHPADFVALAQASSFVSGNKKQLRDVQLAFERIDVPVTQVAALSMGRSVSVASAATMIDVGGKKIRYVGP
ncbi:MAG: hypothetical protein JOZ16_13290 [Methylobacteriaceae bacterium]|nr:hypothetical protein [Methylobacteriaceae bacterium]